jgi:hypothetical protein
LKGQGRGDGDRAAAERRISASLCEDGLLDSQGSRVRLDAPGIVERHINGGDRIIALDERAARIVVEGPASAAPDLC